MRRNSHSSQSSPVSAGVRAVAAARSRMYAWFNHKSPAARMFALQMPLLVFSVLMITGLIVASVNRIDSERLAAESAIEREAQGLTRAFAEHSVRTLHAADQIVQFVRHEYGYRGKRLNLAEFLADGTIHGDVLNLITVVDARGDVVLSSKPFKPMNLLDREHVRVHLAPDSRDLFISKPVLGRVSGKWSIQLTRRINQADGTFGGVIVVSLDPAYFSRFYQSINVGEQGVVSLLGADGIVRARQAAGSSEVGQDMRESALFRELADKTHGLMRRVSRIDGISRLYAYQKLDGYPLYVFVGLSLEEQLRGYIASRNATLMLAGFAVLVTLFFTVLVYVTVARLERSRRAARLASSTKSEFLGSMSHELRTPLNGILGYAEILKADLAGSPQEEFADAILHSAQHLRDLVNSVLDIQRIESGRMELTLEWHRPQALVDLAFEAHRPAAQAKGLTLETRSALGPDYHLHCDATKVRQVLGNLIGNAVKFTDQGSVQVTLRLVSGAVVFGVTDTGPGIPHKYQDAVFERFVRTDTAVAKRNEGAGVGLALCKQLVEFMGGSIRLESAPGRGSTFSFSVPLSQPRAANHAAVSMEHA